MRTTRIVGLAAGVTAAAVASYPLLWREWCQTWGATDEEAQATLPGDDLLLRPDLLTTRAITVETPPSRIWPWLVQMGSGRGGAYTYDWLENLFGLNMHSADEILPQFQDLHIGDVLPVGDGGPKLLVEVLEPDHALVLRSDDGRWVWAFVLQEIPGATRLISRNRIAVPDASPFVRWFNQLVMEPGSLVMEQKMLRGIKERAEWYL
ncbi:SRPBCC family protein [Lentzea sp. BCCO 10_0061]|uniref:SRPBCC family protein n=1 Tax=Lentzea sokolovensis TaxID=3095429 RepID=A0ABU4UPP6_9PSEU|nr:SRPBCC family protein [Lentzea sp. BCCO 10_0061]MDX8141462.1 SRPBCC family protein [Lentzea sp. BCCO 10_0061]